MDWVFNSLITVLLNYLLEAVSMMLLWIFDIVFTFGDFVQAETAIELPNILSIMYGIGVALVIMKFLKKGFEIYVLWTDGDPDSDPFGYLVNFIKAFVVAICFPFLYTFFVEVARSVTNDLLGTVQYTNLSAEELKNMTSLSGIQGIGLIVYFIIFVILFFSFAKRGIELFLLQAGVPLACVGLLDNDKGVFRGYINQIIKAFLTTVIQLFLIKFGLAIVLSPNFSAGGGFMSLVLGIAAMFLALSTPKLMAEFLMPTGGGGGGMSAKIYQTAFVASTVKRLIA